MLKDCLHNEYRNSGICLTCSPPDGWTEQALCLDAHPDTCYPEDDDPVGYEIARTMCINCPVRAYCLEVGLKDKEGMWGAFTPSERRKLLNSTKLPKDRLQRRVWIRRYFYDCND